MNTYISTVKKLLSSHVSPISNITKLLSSPASFFAGESSRSDDTQRAFNYTLLLLIPATILSFLMNLIIPFSGMMKITTDGAQPGFSGLLIRHVVGYFLFLWLSFGFARLHFLILYIPGRMLGSQFSPSKIYQILMYSLTPLFFLGSLPFPNVETIATIWFLVLVIIGYKVFCKVSYLTSAIIVISPLLVVVTAVVFLVFFFSPST